MPRVPGGWAFSYGRGTPVWQIPLQPLADNLESQTYEVFEKDPVKYVNYEQVMSLLLYYSQA